MPLFAFEGARPTVHPEAWIAPTATLIGDVTVEAGASVWFGAVVRADFGPIVIRAGANIQDNSVLHVGAGTCEIGPDATVGHLCVMHHCTVGAQALIGNGATVLDGAVIGERSMIAAGATVLPGTVVPAEHVAYGSPAKRFEPISAGAKIWVDVNPSLYQELARRHRDGLTPVDS